MAQPPAETYKRDRRSFVWATPTQPDGGRFVIKRFEHASLRQGLALLIRRHPGQRELRQHRWLEGCNVAVAPILQLGVVNPCRVWLATPWLGPSLCSLIEGDRQETMPLPFARRQALVAAVAVLLVPLLKANVFNRDLKTTNIVIDAAGKAWLIDAGAARLASAPDHIPRMLAMLDHTAQRDGATRTDRYRCLRNIAQQLPTIDAPTLARQVAQQRLAMKK